MKNAKHIIAIFIVLGVLATAAYLLPKSDIESLWANSKAPAEEVVDTTTVVQDTTPFIDRMKADIGVIQAQYSRRKKRDVWTLGNGATIIRYLLQAKRFIDKNSGKVLNAAKFKFEKDSGSGQSAVSGDANGDGKVNAADIVAIMDFIMGNPTSTGKFSEEALDINADGVINVADIVTIVNIIMGQ